MTPLPVWSFSKEGERAAVDSAVAAARTIDALISDSRVHQAFKWFRSHEREISEFQLACVSVPAPPFGEETRSLWFAERFSALGYQVERDAIGNVLASSGDGDKFIATSAHLDTVFPDTNLNVRREHHLLMGPGISDNGAGLAALWAVAAAMRECAIETALPILFVGNVGEEGSGNLRGMRALFSNERWRGRIESLLVVDGSGIETVITEALGSRRFAVTVSGPGGHSWSDFGLPNPILILARIVARLGDIALPTSPRTTLSFGTIEGGTSINAIPQSATVRVDVRSTAPEEIDKLESLLRRVAEEETNKAGGAASVLGFAIENIGERPAATLRADAPILLALRAADQQLQIASHTDRASTDANIPLSMGIDAIAIGAGGSGGGAHTLREWYDPSGRDLALQRVLLVLLALAGLKR